MKELIASLLQNFEAGRMNRRQLIESLALAATAASVSAVPAVAAGEPFKSQGIRHLSYRVADYKKSREFYSTVLGMKISDEAENEGRAATGNGNMFLHLNGLSSSKKPLHLVEGSQNQFRTPMIDHIEYKIDMSKSGILAELKRRGIKAQAKNDKPDTGIRIKDPDGFDVTLVANAAHGGVD